MRKKLVRNKFTKKKSTLNAITKFQGIKWYLRQLRNKRTNEDHPDESMIKIGPHTEKSPGDLTRLAVTETREENH